MVNGKQKVGIDLFTALGVTDVFNVQPSPCALKEKIFSLLPPRLRGEIV
jgi:hypothetical protein